MSVAAPGGWAAGAGPLGATAGAVGVRGSLADVEIGGVEPAWADRDGVTGPAAETAELAEVGPTELAAAGPAGSGTAIAARTAASSDCAAMTPLAASICGCVDTNALGAGTGGGVGTAAVGLGAAAVVELLVDTGAEVVVPTVSCGGGVPLVGGAPCLPEATVDSVMLGGVDAVDAAVDGVEAVLEPAGRLTSGCDGAAALGTGTAGGVGALAGDLDAAGASLGAAGVRLLGDTGDEGAVAMARGFDVPVVGGVAGRPGDCVSGAVDGAGVVLVPAAPKSSALAWLPCVRDVGVGVGAGVELSGPVTVGGCVGAGFPLSRVLPVPPSGVSLGAGLGVLLLGG